MEPNLYPSSIPTLGGRTHSPGTGKVLDYAKRPRLRWIGANRRWFISLAVVLAVASVVYRQWPDLRTRFVWILTARQCMRHVMPDDTDVIVTDAERATELIKTSDDYVRVSENDRLVAIYCPAAWRRFAAVDWRSAYLAGPSGWGVSQPIVFLGERRRPDGERRLVCINGGLTNYYDLMYASRAFVVPIPGIFDPLEDPIGSGVSGHSGRYAPARLRGGIADPADPTHISIPFEFMHAGFVEEWEPSNTRRGVIDAYLQNDDSIKLSLRNQPFPPGPPPGLQQTLTGGPSQQFIQLSRSMMLPLKRKR